MNMAEQTGSRYWAVKVIETPTANWRESEEIGATLGQSPQKSPIYVTQQTGV
jgi:hypothetical protein